MSEGQQPEPVLLLASGSQPRLACFDCLGGQRLRLSYTDGHTCDVDLAPYIIAGDFHSCADAVLSLGRAEIASDGLTLAWPGNQFDAGILRGLAEQQAADEELLQFWRSLHDSAWSLEQLVATWGFVNPDTASHSQG